MISVYNIHRSPAVWDHPNEFRPERFPLDEPVPSEQTTDYRFQQTPPPSFLDLPYASSHVDTPLRQRALYWCCGAE
jgi:cytochrome P450